MERRPEGPKLFPRRGVPWRAPKSNPGRRAGTPPSGVEASIPLGRGWPGASAVVEPTPEGQCREAEARKRRRGDAPGRRGGRRGHLQCLGIQGRRLERSGVRRYCPQRCGVRSGRPRHHVLRRGPSPHRGACPHSRKCASASFVLGSAHPVMWHGSAVPFVVGRIPSVLGSGASVPSVVLYAHAFGCC